MKEKSERVSELLLVHQRVRDKIREYETVLSMTVKFHQVHQEVKSRLIDLPELPAVLNGIFLHAIKSITKSRKKKTPLQSLSESPAGLLISGKMFGEGKYSTVSDISES